MLLGNARVDAKGPRTQRAADDQFACWGSARAGSRRLLSTSSRRPFWPRGPVSRAIHKLARGIACRGRRLNSGSGPFLSCIAETSVGFEKLPRRALAVWLLLKTNVS